MLKIGKVGMRWEILQGTCIKFLRDLGYSWKDIRIALQLSKGVIEKYKKHENKENRNSKR